MTIDKRKEKGGSKMAILVTGGAGYIGSHTRKFDTFEIEKSM